MTGAARPGTPPGTEPIGAAQLGRLWVECRQQGSLPARNRLIEHYRYLVPLSRERLMTRLPPGIAAGDLDGEGFLALAQAVDRFDPSRGTRFPSYAITRIRGAMLEYLRREDPVPRSVRSLQRRLRTGETALVLRHGRAPAGDADRAAQLDLSLDAYYRLASASRPLRRVSLEEAVREEETGPSSARLGEALRSDGPEPWREALRREAEARVRREIDWLPGSERRVLLLYYYQGLTLAQIGSRIRRSESRAHQLHRRGLRRLAGFLAGSRELFTGAAP